MSHHEPTNLLASLGYSQADIDQRVADTWANLFESDENQRIYFESDNKTAYMLDTGNVDARSEGMSYGMMMAVQMDRRDVFDRLWKWAMTHMYMKRGLHSGYFAWSCRPDGKKNARGPAPDGEEYFALALFFASNRWGDKPKAPFDYAAQARELLRTCVHKGERGRGFPMWNPDNHLIKFVPETEWTDPSYHLPHFYELFAEWAYPEDRDFWKRAAAASRAYIPTACHPVTGLAPEYSEYDGRPKPVRGHGDFYSDSYRVAANIGLDAAWFGRADRHRSIADRIHAFFADKRPEDYKKYQIDGTPTEEPALHPVGLLATNAQAALATEGAKAEQAVRLFWDTPPRTGVRRYYDNCLYFFALLALSGRYRVY
ncbi:MAG: glycosyl hydrolase family 8 [Spirochaetota bacterium]